MARGVVVAKSAQECSPLANALNHHHDQTPRPSPTPLITSTQLSKMTLRELRDELRMRGESDEGTKGDLEKRLARIALVAAGHEAPSDAEVILLVMRMRGCFCLSGPRRGFLIAAAL